jgi:hypothetical protein
VNAVMYLRVQQNTGNLTSYKPISVSRRTLLHEVRQAEAALVYGIVFLNWLRNLRVEMGRTVYSQQRSITVTTPLEVHCCQLMGVNNATNTTASATSTFHRSDTRMTEQATPSNRPMPTNQTTDSTIGADTTPSTHTEAD